MRDNEGKHDCFKSKFFKFKEEAYKIAKLYETEFPGYIEEINPDYAIGKFQSKQTYYKI